MTTSYIITIIVTIIPITTTKTIVVITILAVGINQNKVGLHTSASETYEETLNPNHRPYTLTTKP